MAFCHGEYPVESVGHIKEASKIIQSAKTNKMAEEDDEQEISLSSALETELNDEKDWRHKEIALLKGEKNYGMPRDLQAQVLALIDGKYKHCVLPVAESTVLLVAFGFFVLEVSVHHHRGWQWDETQPQYASSGRRWPPSCLLSSSDRVSSDRINQSEVEICNTLFCCETGFVLGMKNAQHRSSTHFAAMLRDELHVFVDPITVA